MAFLTDPNIALHVQQPESLTQTLGQALALRGAVQQQQLAQQEAPYRLQALQQQAQTGQLQNQELQQHIQDSQTLRTLSPQFVMKDGKGNITGYNYDGLFNAAQQAGVSPQTLAGFQKNISDAALAKANVTKAQLENQQTKNNQAFATPAAMGIGRTVGTAECGGTEP